MSADAQENPRPAVDKATGALAIEARERIAVVRFNRPTERNPLSRATLDELEAAVTKLAARADISATASPSTASHASCTRSRPKRRMRSRGAGKR